MPRLRGEIAAYALLWALLDLLVMLPGNSLTFSSFWGLVGSLVIQGLLVWRLASGSGLAWAFGLLIALGTLASVFLVGPPFGAGEILVAVVCLAQGGLLLVWPLRQPPPASA